MASIRLRGEESNIALLLQRDYPPKLLALQQSMDVTLFRAEVFLQREEQVFRPGERDAWLQVMASIADEFPSRMQ